MFKYALEVIVQEVAGEITVGTVMQREEGSFELYYFLLK